MQLMPHYRRATLIRTSLSLIIAFLIHDFLLGKMGFEYDIPGNGITLL